MGRPGDREVPATGDVRARFLDEGDALGLADRLEGAVGRAAVDDHDLIGRAGLRGDRRDEGTDVLAGVQDGRDQ